MTARALLAITFAVLSIQSSYAHTRPAAPVEAQPGAIVLCYHIVQSPQDPRMEISRDAFVQQMRYLSLTGYTVVPLRDVYEFVSGKRASLPKNAVVITIDDGWRSTYTEVFPELKKRKFPFTVFIYPKIIGQTSYAMTWKQVRELADAGVDIQSHSLSHPYLTRRRHPTLDDNAYVQWLQRELLDSKRILEKETGRTVSFFAYPYGDFDHTVSNTALKAGYEAALTCEFGRVRRGSDPLRMRRMVVDKKMDFASFRRYLGANSMRIQDVMPLPGSILDPGQPMLFATLADHKSIDPKSLGIALMGVGAVPYTYDPANGSISVALRDAVTALKGKYQRALIWATDKAGRRVEATWTFRLPEPVSEPALDPVTCQPVVPEPLHGAVIISAT